MLVTVIRTVILYLLVILSIRLMGKRQVGELQTNELVITFFLSETAAMPIQNSEIPLVYSVAAILLLVSFEIIVSSLELKSNVLRKMLQGDPTTVIRDGKVEVKQLKKIRLTIGELQEALREKDVFDIGTVQYAIMETSGKLSVMLKPDHTPPTAKDLNENVPDDGIPCTVIYDGKIVRDAFTECRMSDEKLNNILSSKALSLENVILMTADRGGNTNIILKE